MESDYLEFLVPQSEWIPKCYHLAGNIVFAVAEGLGIDRVHPAGLYFGFTQHVESRRHEPAIADSVFTVTMGGVIAEAIHRFGVEQSRFLVVDWNEVEKTGGAFTRVVRQAKSLSPNGWLKLLEIRSVNVFSTLMRPANWIRAEGLAYCLNEHGELDGEQISTALRPSFQACDGLGLIPELN